MCYAHVMCTCVHVVCYAHTHVHVGMCACADPEGLLYAASGF